MIRALSLLCLVAASAVGQSSPQSVAPEQPPVVDRFLSRHEAALTSYVAVRHLEARNERFDASASMEVRTELSTDQRLTWNVVTEKGSTIIRNRVFKKALETEAESTGARTRSAAALTGENYVFAAAELAEPKTGATVIVPADATEEDTEEVWIRIRPRREHILLLDGSILLTAAGDLREVTGRVSKRPSFWTRSVDVVRRYGRVNGVRVPLEMSSIADVRLAGRSTFHMTYEYQEINGLPTDRSSATR